MSNEQQAPLTPYEMIKAANLKYIPQGLLESCIDTRVAQISVAHLESLMREYAAQQRRIDREANGGQQKPLTAKEQAAIYSKNLCVFEGWGASVYIVVETAFLRGYKTADLSIRQELEDVRSYHETYKRECNKDVVALNKENEQVKAQRDEAIKLLIKANGYHGWNTDVNIFLSSLDPSGPKAMGPGH